MLDRILTQGVVLGMHQLQKKLLDQIDKYDFASMTLREIGELVGESHPQKIKHHLDQLKRKGHLREQSNGSLAKSQDAGASFVYLPILGRANCGEALAIADDQIDGYLTLSKGFVPVGKQGDLFALKAIGDSMNSAQVGEQCAPINEGDYILVDSSVKSPSDGDYVVSLIDGAANVKKYKHDKQGRRIILQSESKKDYPPIIISDIDFADYMIAGRVVSVIKAT